MIYFLCTLLGKLRCPETEQNKIQIKGFILVWIRAVRWRTPRGWSPEKGNTELIDNMAVFTTLKIFKNILQIIGCKREPQAQKSKKKKILGNY